MELMGKAEVELKKHKIEGEQKMQEGEVKVKEL